MELTQFQKILLALLAGMLLVSGVLMAVFRAHPGVLFEDSLLKITEENGQIVYSGKARNTPVTISVSRPTNFKTVVDFTIGTEIHDVCEISYPLAPIQTEHGEPVSGIRVMKNGETIFTGGYDPDWMEGTVWYDEDGKWAPQAGFRLHAGGGSPWYGYEATLSQIARFAFGPEASARGRPDFFAAAAFISLLLALEVVFHKECFRLRHWAARDPEPSEVYLVLERTGWVICVVIIAGIYVAGLIQIY